MTNDETYRIPVLRHRVSQWGASTTFPTIPPPLISTLEPKIESAHAAGLLIASSLLMNSAFGLCYNIPLPRNHHQICPRAHHHAYIYPHSWDFAIVSHPAN